MSSFEGSAPPDKGQSQFQPQSTLSAGSIASIVLCLFVLIFGLIFAKKYKRRKR